MKGNRKKILLMCVVSLILSACSVMEAKIEEQRKRREQKIVEGYENMKKMVFSGYFIFTATHVYPGGGYPPVHLSSGNYYLEVNIYEVKAVLPFYGVRHLPGSPGESGIRINGKLENLMIQESDSRKRVLVKFSAEGDSDDYLISLNICPNGDANLTISSVKRSSISYNGKVSPIDLSEEEEEKNNIFFCNIFSF